MSAAQDRMTLTHAKRIQRNEVLRALLSELDVHSPGEKDHADRVAVYAVATADKLGLGPEDLLDVRYAALLHDFGKVSLDAQLLKAVGKLEPKDFQLLRLHAELAVDRLLEYDFLKKAIPMIRHHHERWDGTGYPLGLKEDAIPLGARIIGVAESFDVMTLAPSWARTKTEPEALDEIRQHAGTMYDPKVVDAFLKVQPLIQPLGM
jgi:putative two-component system response regulator